MLSIQKYGGSSIASINSINSVAQRLIYFSNNGFKCVVVISAMGDTTDQLITLAKKIDNPILYSREHDMLISVGERISMTLLALAISKRSGKAISYTGSQAGIMTNSQHGNAEISNINPWRIKKALKENYIVIVAGFQGYSKELDSITTLGRGGSDTTAVALAKYMDHNICDIFTDVNGIFTVDPNISSKAKLIHYIDYEKMLLLARRGAQVLSPSSIKYAQKAKIKIHLSSSYSQCQYCFSHQGKISNGSIVGGKSEDKLGVCITGKQDILIFHFKITDDKAIENFIKNIQYKFEQQGGILTYFKRDDNLFIAAEKAYSLYLEDKNIQLQKDYGFTLLKIIEDRSEIFVVDFNRLQENNFQNKVTNIITTLDIDLFFIENNTATIYSKDNAYFETVNQIYDALNQD